MEKGYVLVVDDNMDVRMLLSDVLTMMELPNKHASDGAQALVAVQEERPSLIVLDLMMPVMDGFTFLTKLSSTLKNEHIPVVLLSAIAEDIDSMKNLPNVRGVLRKGSFSIGELRSMLENILEQPDPDRI